MSDSDTQRVELWKPARILRWLQQYSKDPAGDSSGGTYIPRYGQPVLQQKWVGDMGGEEWRCIPTEHEEVGV